ncbi:hypothetical protein C8Q74DRAFT_246916 [Fomes fomentarius]|nr:hypothetical protein C8Q74DRAFT_246916 [Fomes fomentarius]
MDRCAAWFAERGYTCLEIDLGHPESVSTSEALMKYYEKEWCRRWVREVDRTHNLRAYRARIAHTATRDTLRTRRRCSRRRYAHRADLHLLAPRIRTTPHLPAPSNTAASQLLPTPLPEFNFEPRFPCAIMCTKSERATLEKENRLWPDPNVDKMVVRDDAAVAGQDGLVKIEQWLDELGF